MRAALYFRQSEDRTGEEWGIERQREDVMRQVTARGWTVTNEYIDNDISAYTGKPRPAFERMMRAAEAGEIDVIVSKHMDRLLRRLKELEATLERCGTQAFIVTTADGVDTSTEGGRLVARILCSVAQGEVERKGARQKAAAKQAADQGRWTGGRRPFGYQADGLTADPVEAGILRALYSSVIEGESLYSMAKHLNKQGVKTSAGNQWSGENIRQMLIKHRYIGVRTYHGEPVGDGQWEPIIDPDIWRTATAILTAPGRQLASPARKHLLSGLLLCGKCTRPVGSGRNGQHIYKCKHCGGVSRRMEPIDRLAQKLLIGFMGTEEARELLIDRNRPDVAALRERERIILGKIDQLAVDNLDELLTKRQVKIQTDHLQAQLDEIQKNLRRGSRSRAVEELVDNPNLWKGYTLDRRRMVISEVVEFTLLPGRKGVTFEPEHLSYRWLLAEE
jgi:site-specific DNA recombinase